MLIVSSKPRILRPSQNVCGSVDSHLCVTETTRAYDPLGATGRPLLAKVRLRYDKCVMKPGRTDQRASQTQIARS